MAYMRLSWRLYNFAVPSPKIQYTDAMSIWRQFLQRLGLVEAELPASPVPFPQPAAGQPEQITRKVLQIVFDPLMPPQMGRRLSQVMGWQDVDRLTAGYIQDLLTASHGNLAYRVVEKILADEFPLKADGFAYTGEAYTRAMRAHSGFHQPDGVDYDKILEDYHLVERINSGSIDEVWLFGMPYAGFYESRMAGPGAFFCNAPPLEAPGANRRFILMGFSYERGVGEMLEDFGHRAEFTLARAYQNVPAQSNLWARFTRYDKTSHGRAECGTVHYAPNSRIDYDWGNPKAVTCACRNWASFPDLSAPPLKLNCAEWGNGDIRRHHVWWLSLFPHVNGQSDGVAWNWWAYLADPNFNFGEGQELS